MGADEPRRKYPYIPWWLYDYQSDPLVMAMTDDQDLAYRRMIEASWDLGELENNPDKIASLIRFSRRKFASVWKYPLTECWQDNGAGLVNARLEREREKIEASYRQKKRAGIRSGQARRKGTGVERTFNGCSTDVERVLNESDSESEEIGDSKIKDLNIKDDLSLKGVGSGAPSRSARPKVKMLIGRVKWNKTERKLEASDSFKQDFLACWKKEFAIPEIKEEMTKATRWLVTHPHRRGSRSRIDLYLHKWMENALEDRRAREEDEVITSRPIPPEGPEHKWCPKCRETLPRHMGWCDWNEKGGRNDEGDDKVDR